MYYTVCPTGGNWTTALSQCTSAGYDGLATITSTAENNAVFTALGALQTRVWIGFNDIATEAVWVWESGISSSYDNWYDGSSGGSSQPSGDGDCAFMYSPTDQGNYPGTWNDRPCTSSSDSVYTYGFVCEAR